VECATLDIACCGVEGVGGLGGAGHGTRGVRFYEVWVDGRGGVAGRRVVRHWVSGVVV